ncbi:hypothetical protein UlMin_035647 [Ulmus minor]
MNSIIKFSLLHRTTKNSIISTTSSDLSNWSRLSSLWPFLYGTSCCFIEFGLIPRSSPRQAYLILTAGTITQMPKPKYVIAMGACTITGGMFSTDSYSTFCGVDKLISVDVYLPAISTEELVFYYQPQVSCWTSIHTKNYDQGLLYQPPSTSDIPTEIFFKYKSYVSSHELVN